MIDSSRHGDLESYMAAIRARYPEIRPYAEDDWDWMDEGLDYLEDGQLEMAEMIFQQLVLSQPNFPDGYEGLARVYLSMGRKAEAVFLVEEAVRFAGEYAGRGDISPDAHESIVELRRDILSMPDTAEA